jgi:hypothetical protein
MALARREIRERRLVRAANFRVHAMNLAGESVWRKPFSHGVGIQEGPIDFLRCRAEYPVKADGIGWHSFIVFRWKSLTHSRTIQAEKDSQGKSETPHVVSYNDQ